MNQQTFDPVASPYQVEESAFPVDGALEEQFLYLLRYAVLAPSVRNTQPWKFAVSEAGIEAFADYGRRLHAADPGNRELLMSVGAAVQTLRIAASHLGFSCRVSYDYSGASDRPVATIALTPVPRRPGEPELEALFPMITRRQTNRQAFLLSRVPASVIERVRAAVFDGRVGLLVSSDGTLNETVAGLVAEAERRQYGDTEYRKDVAEWMRPNWTQKADGLPGAALGTHGVAAALGPWATRVLDLGRLRAAADRNLCLDAPGLLVLHAEDTVPHWLATGEVLQRVLLTLAREGLQCSYFNNPLQVPELRAELRRVLGLQAWPQLLLRVGYCLTPTARTPRRPLEEVLHTPPTAR